MGRQWYCNVLWICSRKTNRRLRWFWNSVCCKWSCRKQNFKSTREHCSLHILWNCGRSETYLQRSCFWYYHYIWCSGRETTRSLHWIWSLYAQRRKLETPRARDWVEVVRLSNSLLVRELYMRRSSIFQNSVVYSPSLEQQIQTDPEIMLDLVHLLILCICRKHYHQPTREYNSIQIHWNSNRIQNKRLHRIWIPIHSWWCSRICNGRRRIYWSIQSFWCSRYRSFTRLCWIWNSVWILWSSRICYCLRRCYWSLHDFWNSRNSKSETMLVLDLYCNRCFKAKQPIIHRSVHSRFLEPLESNLLFITLVLGQLPSAATLRGIRQTNICRIWFVRWILWICNRKQNERRRVYWNHNDIWRRRISNSRLDIVDLDLYSLQVELEKVQQSITKILFSSHLREEERKSLFWRIQYQVKSQFLEMPLQNSEYSNLHLRSLRSYKNFRVINKSRKTLGIEI